MSISREQFVERLHMIEGAVAESLLIDGVLTDARHNSRARLLRNGLMVVAFNSLEDFLRHRSSELLAFISRTVLRFDDLPRDLMLATTLHAMKSAHQHAQTASKNGEDPVPLLQHAAAEIASTLTGPLNLSRFALGYSGSNVSADEIGIILKTLHLADAWNEVTVLASRVGLSAAMPLRDAYAQGQRVRNQAAHDVSSNVQPTEISSFCRDAKAIALGFDILASRASRLLHDSASPFTQQPRERLARGISILFIDHIGNQYVSRKEGAKRAIRRFDDRDEAWLKSVEVARRNHQPVVERDRSGTPLRWTSTDCP